MNFGNDSIDKYLSKVKPLYYQSVFRSVSAYVGGSTESYQSVTQRILTIHDAKLRAALIAIAANKAGIVSAYDMNLAINAANNRQYIHILRAVTSGVTAGPITPLVVTNRASASDTGVAPFAVQFDASGTTSINTTRPFHDLYHSWNFGDNDTPTWSYGTQAGVAKKNRASGPIAAHVYETPGTYTVNYIAIDPLTGQTASATKTITVQDPNVVFAGTNTICVSQSTTPVQGANGVPADAAVSNQPTWAGVIGLIASGKRILLMKGDTWTTSGANTITGAGGGGIIGAYGVSGANPVVQLTAASTSIFRCIGDNNFIDWRIMDIDGNATGLATGAGRTATRFFLGPELDAVGTSSSGSYLTMLRCTHTNAAGLVLAGNHTTVAECQVPVLDGGGGNVGIWCYQRTNIALLGNNIPDASRGEMNIRLQGVKKAVISDCVLKDPIANGTKHSLAIRGFSNSAASYAWTGDYTEQVVVSNNEISGVSASGTVQFASQNGTSDERHRNILFERNYVKNLTNYGVCVQASISTSTIRNNIFEAVGGAEYAVQLNNSPATTSNGNAVLPPTDDNIYNNVFYSASTVAHAGTFVWINSAAATGIVLSNNLAYLPAYSTRNFILATGGASYTLNTNSSSAQMNTSPNFTTTPPLVYTDWKPTSGYAVNGGTTVPVYDDFFGAQRTYPTADLGAVNP